MTVEVHIDWGKSTYLVGRLFPAAFTRGASFEYASEWLAQPGAFALDPTSLPLQRGAFHGASLFGAFQDCGPDRWGRVLVERAWRKRILPAKPVHDLDYVLALDDLSRIGAIRFRLRADGEFLAPSQGKLPPLVRLGALIRAADAVHNDSETAKDLRFLLSEGSPLGGARPKSVVVLPGGALAIAKFPKPDDTRDIAAGEILALTLAEAAGISTAGHQLVTTSRRNKSVAVVTRFDRGEGGHRVPFLSASTLLGVTPGASGSYTQIADVIRGYGEAVTCDLHELWRRMVFSLLVCNYDDHLRNHGFLMRSPGRWSLAPAYDLNPVPEAERTGLPATPVSEDTREPSLEGAFAVASRFALKPSAARSIVREILQAVSHWKKTARKLRLSQATMDAYESAFEHPLTEEARRLKLS